MSANRARPRPIRSEATLPDGGFDSSHPVRFALSDQNNQQRLYIDDSSLGRPVLFEVHNAGDRAIQFESDGETVASAANYHFELQFRKGALSAETLAYLRTAQTQDGIFESPESWDIYLPAVNDEADHISLYILHKGDNPWLPNTRRSLRLRGISADPEGGARGTRVVLQFNRLSYVDNNEPVTGMRTLHLSVVNQRGAEAIPLHVGFKGSNQVLNTDNAQSTLTLQIVNTVRLARTHADIPVLALPAGGDDRPPARLILEFDVQPQGEERAWALAAANELRLTITAVIKRRGQAAPDNGAQFEVVRILQGISPQWELIPRQDAVLNPGDTLEVVVSGILSSLPSGPTNLYVHYQNISRYRDGYFIVPVMKSPLLYSDGNVSIGRADPSARLKIEAGSGLALRVEPDPGKAVHIGRSALDGLAFDETFGQALNSRGSISLNIDTNNSDSYQRYIDLRANGGIGGGQRLMRISEEGQVIIGSTTYAGDNNYMRAGSLTVGNVDQDYGGATMWNFNTAGLMLECASKTEVVVHDADTRLASLLYYEGEATNQITIGRDMGWGTTKVGIADSLFIGSNGFAFNRGVMAAGSLTIGNVDQNYGGGSSQWTNSTAGLLFECAANTEIAVHDLNHRVASLIYYQGDTANQITIGRNMGWGTSNVHIAGNLAVEGALSKKFKRWWHLQISDDTDWGNTRIGLIENAQWSNSDARLKTDIQPIPDALSKVTQLQGITYKWSEEGLTYLTGDIDTHIIAEPGATEEANLKARAEARSEVYQILSRTEVGLLAQDVEQVLPEMVRTGEDGYKSIRYDLMTALLVEAVKELKAELRKIAPAQGPEPMENT